MKTVTMRCSLAQGVGFRWTANDCTKSGISGTAKNNSDGSVFYCSSRGGASFRTFY